VSFLDAAASRPWLRTLAAVAVLVLGGGCAHGRDPQASRAATVTERDFHISAPAALAAGQVRLRVHNLGPEAHELIVVRTSSEHALPLRADGLTVDEDAVEKATLGVLEPGRAGTTRELTLHLAPGHYVMFCNMSGHFLGGMHAELAVQ